MAQYEELLNNVNIKIKSIASAILEKEEYGQLCPKTVDELKKVKNGK